MYFKSNNFNFFKKRISDSLFMTNKTSGVYPAPFFGASKKGAGFTLIELLISITIIVVLTTWVLVGLGGAQRKYALTQATQNLKSNLRRAQNMSIATSSDVPDGGFGIYFDNVPSENTAYRIIADTGLNGTVGTYDGQDRNIEKIKILNNIHLSNIQVDFGSGLTISSDMFITFIPPKALPHIDNGTFKQAIITLSDNQNHTKSISINSAGVIETQ